MKIRTTILTADKPSLNNRVYTREALQNAVDAFHKCQPTLLCSNNLDPVLDLSLVSHQITDLELEGDNLIATMTVMDTPKGHQLREMIEAVGEDAVEARPCGVGIVDTETTGLNGEKYVRNEYRVTSVVIGVKGPNDELQY